MPGRFVASAESALAASAAAPIRTLSFYLMEKIDTTTKTNACIQSGRCCGHILRTAKGFKACDANDKEIGVFETPAAGIVALLEVAFC